eukprot:scaffold19219_cov52-Phaeocystis_antarctica.AAC.1
MGPNISSLVPQPQPPSPSAPYRPLNQPCGRHAQALARPGPSPPSCPHPLTSALATTAASSPVHLTHLPAASCRLCAPSLSVYRALQTDAPPPRPRPHIGLATSPVAARPRHSLAPAPAPPEL